MSDFDAKEKEFNVLHKVSENVWTYLVKFSFLGLLPLHNRTIVYRLPPSDESKKGVLVLVNPSNPADPRVFEGLKKLEADTNSTVEYLCSPCDWHWMFMGHYLKDFPNARCYIPPGRIELQKPKFPYTLIDMSNPLPELAPHLRVLSVNGMSDKPSRKPPQPRREFVFFHPASKSITSGDSFYYFASRTITNILAGHAANSLSFHYKGWKVVSDRDQCCESVKKILEWDFDRYICIHGALGNMLTSGAKEHMNKVFAWLDQRPRGRVVQEPAAVAADKSSIAPEVTESKSSEPADSRTTS